MRLGRFSDTLSAAGQMAIDSRGAVCLVNVSGFSPMHILFFRDDK